METDILWLIIIIVAFMWAIVALGAKAYQGNNPEPETLQPKLIPKQPHLLTEICTALKDPAQREEFNKGSKFKCEPIWGEDKWGLKSEQTPGFYIQQVDKHLSLQQIIDTPEGINKQEAEVIVWAILKHAFSSLKLPVGKSEEKILPILLELTFEQAAKDWNESVVKALETTSKVYAQEVGPTFEVDRGKKYHLLDDIMEVLEDEEQRDRFGYERNGVSCGTLSYINNGKVSFYSYRWRTLEQILAISDNAGEIDETKPFYLGQDDEHGKITAYKTFKAIFSILELSHLPGYLRRYGGLFERFVEEEGYTVVRALEVINEMYVRQCQKTKTLTK